ncbi:MAG TPA: transketolase [Aquificales bacterium]|nr:transketolase [Aquificales bacterium]
MNPTKSIEELKELARQVRIETIKSIYLAGSGHPGGSLSITDILVALYFGGYVNVDPQNPYKPDRDRVILSKGHAAPSFYAVLALKGFFDKELLYTLRKLGSPLQGHVSRKHTPGVEASTGSLGQGLSIALGMALKRRLDNLNYKVFCLLSDGELQEGMTWEAVMTAKHFNAKGLIAIIDNNNIQLDDFVTKVNSGIYPIEDKFKASGWHTITIDGHDFSQILKALDEAVKISEEKPVAIRAITVKGKGVSYMENTPAWHGKAPDREKFIEAMKELGVSDKEIEEFLAKYDR